jgi:hypothetical protein
MQNIHEQRVTKSCAHELRGFCVECGTESLIAYWDEELEYYIYLVDVTEATDTFSCVKCESVSENGIMVGCT